MRHFTNFCLLLIIIYPYLILALLPLVSVDFSCFFFYLESLHSKMKKKKFQTCKTYTESQLLPFWVLCHGPTFPERGFFFSFSRLVLSLCHENRKKLLSPIFTPEREQVNSLRKTLSSFCYASCFYFVWDKVGCIPPWLNSNPMELKTA